MNCCRETTKLGTRLSKIPLAVRCGTERSAASVKKMGVPPGNRPAVPRDWFPYLNGTSQGLTPEDARLPAPLLARRAYSPEGRAYSSERRTAISSVAVTPGRDEIPGLKQS